MSALNELTFTRISRNNSVDMNSGTPQLLYTVPLGKSLLVTHIMVRLASANLTTASFSFGFTSANYEDVIANATHTALTGVTLYELIPAKVGALVGTAGTGLYFHAQTPQGGAATAMIDVFGYLI